MPRQIVTDEVKAAAMADLVAGDQPAVVALRYGINRQTVKAWRMRLQPGMQPMTTAHPVQPEMRTVVRFPAVEDHQRRIVDLMYRLLCAKLEASERLAQLTATDWVDRQSAEGIAELGDFLDRTAAGILALLVRRGNTAGDDQDSS